MPGPLVPRVGRVGAVIVFVAVAFAGGAAEVLFPEPRHFVRRIDDPVSGTSTTVDEYCAGNQVVTVSGARVAIADYGKQELLEIDAEAGTYSVTKFDDIARAQAELRAMQPGNVADGGGVTVDVKSNPNVVLSRGAAEVLVGAAYPNARNAQHEKVLNATRVRDGRFQIAAQGADADAQAMHLLPAEQTITFEHDGERVTMRNAVVSVTADRAPQHLLLIPPGAERVESRLTRLAREMRQLDGVPANR